MLTLFLHYFQPLSKCKKTILFLVPIFASVTMNIMAGYYTSFFFLHRVVFKRDSNEVREMVAGVSTTFRLFSALAGILRLRSMHDYGLRLFVQLFNMSTTKSSVHHAQQRHIYLLSTYFWAKSNQCRTCVTYPDRTYISSYLSSSHNKCNFIIVHKWGVSAASCAQLMSRYGFRKVALVGSALLICSYVYSSLATTADIQMAILSSIMGGL